MLRSRSSAAAQAAEDHVPGPRGLGDAPSHAVAWPQHTSLHFKDCLRVDSQIETHKDLVHILVPFN